MTTRLSQKKVKGGDPSYPTLKDELQSRLGGGTGSGYVIPTGGIPKADLTTHLQDLLTLVEASKMIKTSGVDVSDLAPDVKEAYDKAMSAYQKPTGGITASDLEASIQQRLSDFSNYYVYPSSGIPRVDLDGTVNDILLLAESAYQKPVDGIAENDIHQSIIDMINLGISRYELPSTGIPASDLEESYVTTQTYQTVVNHMNDETLHITDHDKLINIGNYTHRVIDDKLDKQESQLTDILAELATARSEFSTIGNRMNSLLGLNAFHAVQTRDDWERGTLSSLVINDEGFVGLPYTPEKPLMELFDISSQSTMTEDNQIGILSFETNSRIFLGTKPWQAVTGRYNQVGVRLSTYIYVDKSGTYEFATQFSGRTRLLVGSKLLYDTQGLYGQVDAYTRTASIELEAGRLYPILLEGWYDFEGDRVVGLSWKQPGAHSFIEIAPQYFNNSGYTVQQGIYESEVIDMNDNNISKWIFELDASENRGKEDIVIQLRSSYDGADWLDWMEIEDSGEILLKPQRFIQVRIRLNQFYKFYSPVIRGYRIRFITSSNHEMVSELTAARDKFLSLEERFLNIESMIEQLTHFIELQENALFHPEHFASIRLASQELNIFRVLLLQLEKETNYLLLDNGIADVFKTVDFIDNEKSDPYEVVSEAIRAMKATTRLEGNKEWALWDLHDLDYVNGELRLDYSYDAAVSARTAFSNWYLWSTRDTARIAGNYQAYSAQPFYTSADVNLITRLQLQTYDYSYMPQHTFMICETRTDADLPNVSNPVWAVTSWSYGVVNFPNLRVPVKPATKYWIVLKRETLQTTTGYARWYLSYNNTSTNARLRGTNPESAYLYLKYTADSKGQTGWLTDSGYFLSFHIDEALAFKSSGSASRVIDYEKPVSFVSASVTQNLAGDGITEISYQGSNDTNVWSEEVTNIDQVPDSRFLKININIRKASTGNGSPRISRIDLYNVMTHSDVITNAVSFNSIPTHAIYLADHDEGVQFFISRDDGVSWKELLKDEYTQLDDIMPGQSVRFKMRFLGTRPEAFVRNYAFAGTTYRDITQQNVTALYEEYIANEEQTVFKLRDPYVLGNHSLQVYLNGVRQSVLKDYMEVDRYTVQFNEPLIGGLDADRVTFVVSTGAYDLHDAQMHHKIEEAQEQARALNQTHSKTHQYNVDGQLISTTYNPEYFVQSLEYEYDANGRKLKETKTTKTYVEVIEYNYNEQGYLIGESVKISEVTI